MNMKKINTLLLALVFCLSIQAQHHHDDTYHATKHHAYHKHHIAVFNGGTTNFDHHVSGYTMGIDYEFRFAELFGIGLTGEYLFLKDGEGESIFALPVYFHPVKGLKLSFAPMGVHAEVHQTTSLKSGSALPGTEYHAPLKEWYFGSRINVGYDIPIGQLSVGPIVGLDMFNHTKALVYEISFGYGF